MIRRHVPLQAEAVEERILRHRPLAHHRPVSTRLAAIESDHHQYCKPAFFQHNHPEEDIASGAWMYQFDAVTEARTVLLATLRRVIDGGDVTNDELDAAIIAPADLRGAERKAWHGLSYWADDDDIRAKDPAYALSRTWQLSDLLSALEDEEG
jgi:hypothetical protein